MTKEELKKEAKIYAKRKFDEEEQAYLHDIIAQTYFVGAEPREKRIEELEKENAELKADNDARKYAMAMSEKVEKQLREQLTKAKGLLAKWVELFKPKGSNIPPTPIQVETEQFLKEIEK